MGRIHLSILTASLSMTGPEPRHSRQVVIEFGLNRAPASSSHAADDRHPEGGLDYFGRILLAIPEDCTLSPKSLHGSFALDEEEGRAVVSWLKLPEADRFDLQFDLKVAPDAPAGTREITSSSASSAIRTRPPSTPSLPCSRWPIRADANDDLASAPPPTTSDASGAFRTNSPSNLDRRTAVSSFASSWMATTEVS